MATGRATRAGRDERRRRDRRMTSPAASVAPAPRAWSARIWGAPACRSSRSLLALLVGAIVILGSELLLPDHEFDWLLPITAYARSSRARSAASAPSSRRCVADGPARPRRAVGRPRLQGRPLQHRRAGPVPHGRPRSGHGRRRGRRPAADRRDPVASRPASRRGVWGFIPGILKAVSGAHEVVTTIMLNYIAIAILAWAVSGPLKVAGLALADHDRRRQRRLPDPPRPTTATSASSSPSCDGLHLRGCSTGRPWLRDPDRRREPRRRALRRDAPAAAHRPDDVDVRPAGRSGRDAHRSLGRRPPMTSSFGTTVGFDAIAVALLGPLEPVGIIFSGPAVRRDARRRRRDADPGRDPGRARRRPPGDDPAVPRDRPGPAGVFRLRGVDGELAATETITRSYGREAVA